MIHHGAGDREQPVFILTRAAGEGDREAVEGAAASAIAASTPNSASSLKYVRRRETKHANANALEPLIARQLMPRLIRMTVACAIHFNSEFCG